MLGSTTSVQLRQHKDYIDSDVHAEHVRNAGHEAIQASANGYILPWGDKILTG